VDSLPETDLIFNNLYKILLVDDEEPIRKGLKFAIDWRSLGYRIADDARNATEALKLLENNQYDVLVSDIRMPKITGLELAEIVKNRYPQIKIIMISGYSYFEYAVTAMKLGVKDYILKPINKEAVIDIFTKLKIELDQKRIENSRLVDGSLMAKRYFFHHLIQNDYSSAEQILGTMERLGLIIPDRDVCILNLRINDFPDSAHDKFSKEAKNEIDEINEQIRQTTGLGELISTFIGMNHVFLVQVSQVQVFIAACQNFMSQLSIPFKLGVGEAVESIEYFPLSYRQAVEAIQLHPENTVSFYNKGTDLSKSYSSQLFYYQKKLIENIEKEDYEAIQKTVDLIFNAIGNSNIDFIYSWILNSIHEIIEYFSIDAMKQNKINYHFSYPTTLGTNLYESAKALFMDQLIKIVNMIKSLSSEPNRELVKKACEMIEVNYSDNEFSMNVVARKLNISYGYLCTIFKKFTGENFTDFMIKVRMKHARRIIQEGSHKIYEIADLVGYASARYFALAFRKYYGMTPSEYGHRKQQD
jgi:two-component system response regulator YesN